MRAKWISLLVCLVPAFAQTNQSLRQLQSLPLNVTGQLGHMALDPAAQRLFIAATDANTVEVYDLAKGSLLRSVPGFDKPTNVVFIPADRPAAHGIVYVSNADGKLRSFDATAWSKGSDVDLKSPAGFLRYDAASKKLYAGTESGRIVVVDPVTGNRLDELNAGGKLDDFFLENGGKRIFASVSGAISVLDRGPSANPLRIPITWAQDNHAVALDENNHRLFVAARKPVKMLVMDSNSNDWITETSFPDVPNADQLGDIFYDAAAKRVYLLCGSVIVKPDHVGLVYVFDQLDADHYVLKDKVVTGLGARNGLYLPERNQLIVALPASKTGTAEVRVYSTK